MSQREQSAQLAGRFEHLLRCPHCHSSMKVVDVKSLICPNRHTFDFAKQGYVNMLTRAVNSHYDKELFTARHSIIVESHLYTPMHEQIAEIIQNQLHDPSIIVDAGCGEGSHLNRILQACENEAAGIGLDISKEAILMAAKNYRNTIWFVGDLANMPIAEQSCPVILNILSPANYKEFKRILVPEGIVVKVVPRADYLRELRFAFHDETDLKAYSNEETVSLFSQQFQLVDVIRLHYTKELNRTELISLAKMSPLSWNTKAEELDKFINQDSSKITIDLDILVGMKR